MEVNVSAYNFNIQLYHSLLVSRKDNSFNYAQEALRKTPKRFENANDKYTILEDDAVYNQYLDGLNQDSGTRHIFERHFRHKPLLKKDLLNQDKLNGKDTELTAKELLKSTKPNFVS